jgi:hypothetical protein
VKARNPSQRQNRVVAEPNRIRLAKTRLRVIPKLSPYFCNRTQKHRELYFKIGERVISDRSKIHRSFRESP